jgi:hypothetical protein
MRRQIGACARRDLAAGNDRARDSETFRTLVSPGMDSSMMPPSPTHLPWESITRAHQTRLPSSLIRSHPLEDPDASSLLASRDALVAPADESNVCSPSLECRVTHSALRVAHTRLAGHEGSRCDLHYPAACARLNARGSSRGDPTIASTMIIQSPIAVKSQRCSSGEKNERCAVRHAVSPSPSFSLFRHYATNGRVSGTALRLKRD